MSDHSLQKSRSFGASEEIKHMLKDTRIYFERTGGFAGLQLKMNMDLNELDDEISTRILDLLDDMDFFELPERLLADTGAMDQFSYTIEVETTERSHTVTTGDASAPEDMQELIKIFNKLIRKQKKAAY
jgi:hypothetical protein